MKRDSKQNNLLIKSIESRLPSTTTEDLKKIDYGLRNPEQIAITKAKIQDTTTLERGAEKQKLILSFEFFNQKTSVFTQFNDARAKKLINIFATVTNCSVDEFPNLKLIRDSIGRGNKTYNNLFDTVDDSVQNISETEFIDGRIFFIVTGHFFHLVSIETKHRDIYS